ncbi:linoleate 13S-lipoxygenase 3-1, chloroplastic-like protein [Tanacetum coccineum]
MMFTNNADCVWSHVVHRGMAVPDSSQRHGIKLLIKDYPYASDGLLIWEAIQNWVQTYVTRYYPDLSLVCNDRELQAWYAETKREMWFGDAEMVEAFYGFASEIQRIEKEIEKRNRDMSLKNRCGAGVLPYELLAPSSKPGVTCRVIPNSVSI